MSRLEPCPSCSRHVRVGESACPFCERSLPVTAPPRRPMPSGRLSRAATLAFGASVLGATALVACEDDEPDPGAVVPIYGAPLGGSSNEVPEPGASGQGGQAGAPAAEGGQSGAPPAESRGAGGQAFAVYGGPPGGDGSL
ncbi:MAG: hypothetical protein EOO73_08805 [Myxococcales bacterium]|nr:MAG: hypothetical protein EOO73_08805 [Myxococcales bacterium]